MRKSYLYLFQFMLIGAISLAPIFLSAQSILEAEDVFFSAGKIDTKHAGYTGTGFVDTDNAVGVYVEWFINLQAQAHDTLNFRYALGKNEHRYMEVYANEQLLDTIDFDDTGAFTTWVYKSVPAILDSGINRIKLLSINIDGAPNLDHLRIASDTLPLPYYPLTVTSSGNGTVSKSVAGDSAQAGMLVELTATANPGYTFSHWSGDLDSMINPVKLLMDQPYNIQANFLNSLPAFPGAQGFGKNTTGGRGGAIIEVTNLNDNGPGSLRSAINTPGTRTIVFRVSGTIYLNSNLTINHDNLTIAGQTAPGDGICLANYPLNFSANNIIVRYIRSRLGDVSVQETDAINCRNVENVIIDHCSFSWSVDEVASPYLNKNFTMQWCLLSESLYRSVHSKGDHGYGGIWGGDHVTFHHNLLAHHTSRNPRFNGSRFIAGVADHVDYRNNVVYNWGFNSAYGGEPSEIDGTKAQINMVNNYYRSGPATNSGSMRYRILEPSNNNFGFSDWYIDGNHVHGYPNATTDNWRYGVQDVTANEKMAMRVNQPFSFDIDSTHTPQVAFEHVLANVGCRLPNRDSVDLRVIEETCTGTATYGGAFTAGTPKGIIDSQADVGGWPTLNSTAAPLDSDHDGMPDDWEQNRGLDRMDPNDRNGDDDSDGYTNVEEYLNSLVDDFTYVVRPIDVTATKQGNADVKLNWTDIAEHEDGYILERSDNGNGFVPIDTLAANVTSFLDSNLPNAVYEYRLKTVNAADSSCYTEPVEVSITTGLDGFEQMAGVHVFPNPLESQLVVSVQLEQNSALRMELFNLQGQLVFHQLIEKQGAGTHQFKLEIPTNLASGLYLFQLTSIQGRYTQRLSKR